MEKEKKSEFEELMEKADKLYVEGQYEKSLDMASKAIICSPSAEDEASALDRRAWSCQKIGYKTTDKNLRINMYNIAREDWFDVFMLTQNFERIFSTIKGRMLVLSEEVNLVKVEIEGETLTLKKEIADLYQLGEEKIERCVKGQEAQNLKAELLNSLGIEVRKYDPEIASKIFTCGYMIIGLKTREAGNLQHNKATCYLMLKNQTKDKTKKLIYANLATIYLNWALLEYPKDQKEHRDRVQEKIDNTLMEIKNNFE